jgi:hypothetical protein
MSFNQVNITRLEKAATDNGFDLERGREGDWLVFDSSHASLRIWLTALGESLFLVALSRMDVFDALAPLGVPFSNPLPKGAAAARGASDVPSLHRLVRRAFQLGRALPDEPLKVFLDKTASLPRTTEAERLDVFNGILLAPNLDATFDRGFLTITNEGIVIVSDRLEHSARKSLNLDTQFKLVPLTDRHRKYLEWHRKHVACKGSYLP